MRPDRMRALPDRRRSHRVAPGATAVLAAAATLALLTGCATGPALSPDDGRLQVVTTSGILRDLVANVGGDRVTAASIVPDEADPHSYEPGLRDVRDVVYADVAFSNYLLLEEHSVITTLDANLRPGTPNISLAEGAVKYAAEIIPLVEDLSLDTVWLGLRARGDGADLGATRASDVTISATAAAGPGEVFAYLTGSFGEADRFIDSADGFDAADGYRDDTVTLPADAHTHMSWVFTKPGVYTLTLQAALRATSTSKPVPLGSGTYVFAVGVDPQRAAKKAGIDDPVVLDQGHADLTVDLEARGMTTLYDPTGGGDATQRRYDPARVVISVPNAAISEVPAGRQFGFLGRAGSQVYQLPQAVLGKHVHGEIDPHLWQNVRNVIAYTKLIRDTLVERDPAGASVYRANADRYIGQLEQVDDELRATVAAIPSAHRQLVTTHDAFGYLAAAYGLKVAGFVTPNPATEPSPRDIAKLTTTVKNLDVPAVFLEPNLASRSSTLTEIAARNDIRVCRIYGDSFGPDARTYLQMMRFNARTLADCLG